jgi:hypothetical protein
MRRTGIIALAVLGAVGIGGSVPTLYSVQTDTSPAGQLIWNPDEAYLAIGVRTLGWRRSPLRVLYDRFLNQFGSAAQDQKRSSVLFRITPTTVHQHVTEIKVGTQPWLSVLDGQITDYFSRWTGDGFELLTAEQKRRAITFPTGNFSDVNGWSGQGFWPNSPAPSGRKIPFTLSGTPMVLILFGEMQKSAAIDLQLGDQPPERLWSLDGRHRFVSKSEYMSLFGE